MTFCRKSTLTLAVLAVLAIVSMFAPPALVAGPLVTSRGTTGGVTVTPTPEGGPDLEAIAVVPVPYTATWPAGFARIRTIKVAADYDPAVPMRVRLDLRVNGSTVWSDMLRAPGAAQAIVLSARDYIPAPVVPPGASPVIELVVRYFNNGAAPVTARADAWIAFDAPPASGPTPIPPGVVEPDDSE